MGVLHGFAEKWSEVKLGLLKSSSLPISTIQPTFQQGYEHFLETFHIGSGQIIIFHQPRFPWNKRIPLVNPPFGGSHRSCFRSRKISFDQIGSGHQRISSLHHISTDFLFRKAKGIIVFGEKHLEFLVWEENWKIELNSSLFRSKTGTLSNGKMSQWHGDTTASYIHLICF